MKKTSFATLFTLILLAVIGWSCSKSKTPPVSERIAKVWTARTVDENSTTVYTRGATSNIRSYASFKLDLSSQTSVRYTEFDNNTFTGQWEVQNDNRLILKNLNPQPTGSNGTIEFTINSINDTELVLTRTSASQKTGGSINKYTLTNP